MGLKFDCKETCFTCANQENETKQLERMRVPQVCMDTVHRVC
jgi:hypothetical protein